MGVARAVVLLQFALTHALADLRLALGRYALALVNVVVRTVAPAFLMPEGVRRVGANRTAAIGSLGPVVRIALGRGLLDEPLSSVQRVGARLVPAGVLLVSRPGGKRSTGSPF